MSIHAWDCPTRDCRRRNAPDADRCARCGVPRGGRAAAAPLPPASLIVSNLIGGLILVVGALLIDSLIGWPLVILAVVVFLLYRIAAGVGAIARRLGD